MEIRDYYRIIRRRGWILVLSIVVGTLGGLALGQVQTPIYRSTVFLNVRPLRLDWGLQQTIKGLLRNYAINVTSRDTALRVIEALDLEMTSDQLRGKLKVTPIESDFLLRLDADDGDPHVAQDIAQTTAEQFEQRIHTYMLKQDKRDRVQVTIRDYATPGTLHRPRRKINIAAGAMLGAVLGTAVVFVLRWLEADMVQSRDDLERHTDMAVLAIIPPGSP